MEISPCFRNIENKNIIGLVISPNSIQNDNLICNQRVVISYNK